MFRPVFRPNADPAMADLSNASLIQTVIFPFFIFTADDLNLEICKVISRAAA
jgi:hypothetical protein